MNSLEPRICTLCKTTESDFLKMITTSSTSICNVCLDAYNQDSEGPSIEGAALYDQQCSVCSIVQMQEIGNTGRALCTNCLKLFNRAERIDRVLHRKQHIHYGSPEEKTEYYDIGMSVALVSKKKCRCSQEENTGKQN